MRTVKEVSALTGVTVRTLRYYDRIGLLRPEAVTAVGYRLYGDAALERLRHILLYRELGFSLPDSSTNFVFASHEKFSALGICEYLKSRDIYVRYFKKPRIDDRLRITVGTDSEIDSLLCALREYISGK